MSTYPPAHHQEAHFKNIIQTLKTFPLATLITVENESPVITHLPLRYVANMGYGKLIGHIDNNNPQVPHLAEGSQVTVLFNGPDTYISPSIYTTSQLPTWNYIKIHLETKVVKTLTNEELKSEMVALTSFLEGNEQRYRLEQTDPRVETFVNYVTGFELQITAWEGKFKLSQDKNSSDQEQAKQALTNNYADLMENYLTAIYSRHITKG